MMRKLSLLALFSLTAGCVAEPGASIQLAHVMAPDQQCQYKPDGKEMRMDGFYDPANDVKMEIAVRVMNSMNARDTDARTNDNNTNLKPSGNTVSINGFNVCYKQVNSLDEFGNGDSGNALNCDDIINATDGEYKEFVPAGGLIEPDPTGQETGMPVSLDLFTRAVLQGMFGPGLLPEYAVDEASASDLSDQCMGLGVAADGTASAACNEAAIAASSEIRATSSNLVTPGGTNVEGGEGWPWGNWALEDAPQQRILVTMQAVGVTTAGAAVKSNWLNFPVDLCMGCTVVSTFCETNVEKVLCDFGTCSYDPTPGDPDNDDEVENEACVNPAGRTDGQSGCSNPAIPCQGMSSSIRTYEDVYEGFCSESQRLGTNVSGACFSEDPCTAE